MTDVSLIDDMKTNSSEIEKKYNKWIILLSVVIPVAVALLFVVKIPNATPLSFLPPIYATINGITAILLVVAVMAVKNGKRKLHELLMKCAIGCSLLFLVMYIAYHMTSESTVFGGEGNIRYVYYFILLTHILLSIAIIPLVLITYVRGLAERFDKHRKIAKITFPLWLYVAVTGVVVYLMISPYYIH
jgi:putative membrane protein